MAADKAPDLDGRKLALSETVGSLRTKGVNFDSALPEDAPALLIAADEADGVHWRVGYNNFYVITRYNHSALYAMAVYELAAAVKQRILSHDAPATGAGAADRCSVAAVNAAAWPCRACSVLGWRAARARGVLCDAAAAHARTAAPAGAGRAAGRAAAAGPCPMPCRASSRARATAIRRSTMCSASATTCSPRASATWSAASPPGMAPAFTRCAPPPARPTTCTA